MHTLTRCVIKTAANAAQRLHPPARRSLLDPPHEEQARVDVSFLRPCRPRLNQLRPHLLPSSQRGRIHWPSSVRTHMLVMVKGWESLDHLDWGPSTARLTPCVCRSPFARTQSLHNSLFPQLTLKCSLTQSRTRRHSTSETVRLTLLFTDIFDLVSFNQNGNTNVGIWNGSSRRDENCSSEQPDSWKMMSRSHTLATKYQKSARSQRCQHGCSRTRVSSTQKLA